MTLVNNIIQVAGSNEQNKRTHETRVLVFIASLAGKLSLGVRPLRSYPTDGAMPTVLTMLLGYGVGVGREGAVLYLCQAPMSCSWPLVPWYHWLILYQVEA